jgi:tetratricopeptide (TPR) repeat protein
MRDGHPLSTHAAAMRDGRPIPKHAAAMRDGRPILVAMSPASQLVYDRAAQMVAAGRFAESVPLITDLIRLDGLKPEFFVLRSRAYIGANRPREALIDGRKAAILAPKLPDGYYQEAAAHTEMRQAKAALSCSDIALKLGGPRWYFSTTRSEIFEQLNEAKQSLAAAEEAIKLKPDESLCYFRKAIALLMLHRDQEALALSNKAISMAPRSYYFYKRAVAYLGLKKYAEAVADFNEVQRLEVNPKAELYRLRGYAYTQLRDYAHAAKDYEKIPRQNLSLLQDRATLHRKTHDTKSLLDDLNQILKLQPNNANALHERPLVLFTIGAYQDCVNDCSKLIAASSDNAQWYYLRGYSYAKLKSYDSAASDLTKAIQAAPTYNKALALRAKVYRKLGKESLAIKDEQMVTEFSGKK